MANIAPTADKNYNATILSSATTEIVNQSMSYVDSMGVYFAWMLF